ncbi:MAG: hypothetical protein IJQ65_09355 [Kiritimatiellae bacterium]|nr:hypothetical protein [Kiritimatiellia bacterium]
MKHVLWFAAGVFAIVSAANGALPSAKPVQLVHPTDVWAGIASHPAVVNPVSVEKFGRGPYNISLAGQWDFAKFNHGSGRRTVRYKTDLWADGGRKVRVPSCWEAQGVGEPGRGIPCLCQDNAPKMLRHVFVGEGWYRRYVDIPASWAGMRVWLKLGGVRSQGWAFVNDNPVCWLDAGNGAWKWDVTGFVKPGERAKIVVMADNAVASRGGFPSSSNRYGGIWRDVELEATPQTCIDDVFVRGDFDAREARFCVAVDRADRARGARLALRVAVEGCGAVEAPVDPSGRQEIVVPLADFRPWSCESPHLYWADVELLEDGKAVQTRHERFGVRKIEVRGKEFYMNGKPFYVRGFGDNPQYPMTGISPADRDFHRGRLSRARRAGFNFIRHHTHSEADEYMDVCDELGIIVEPEIPYYLDNPNDYFGYDPVRDANDLIVAFRRHPCFGVLSFGNEGLLGPAANKLVYEHVKAVDPDILVLAQDGGTYICDHGEGCSDYASGPLAPWARGTFNPRTFVCHEYMNLAAKFDWRDERDYTGLWQPPMTAESRRAHLAHTGLSMAWLERLQDASHALQAYWQKNGVEIARADPYCDGFIYWTIADSTVYNKKTGTYTGQGLFTPFWGAKRHGHTPESFAVFNSPTCVLLDTETTPRDYTQNTNELLCCSDRGSVKEGTNRVFAVGEAVPVEFIISHYGERPLRDASLSWRFAAQDGSALASGVIPLGDRPIGPARSAAKFLVAAPEVDRPTRADLVVELKDADTFAAAPCRNSWPFWFFPAKVSPATPANVAVVALGSPEEASARAAGKNLLVLANQTGPANFSMGWWNIGAQVGTAVLRHPALGDFPYEPYLSPLLFRIIKEGSKLPVPGWDEKDMVIVGEGRSDAYLYLGAKTLLDGRREVLVSGLDITSDTPEGRSLLLNILKWLGRQTARTDDSGI